VALNEILTSDLSTPTKNNEASGTSAVLTVSRRSDIQVDFYGPSSGDQARAFTTAFKTEHMAGMLPDWVRPLYTSDAVNAPLISGEQQYVARWIVTVSLQFNPVIKVPIQTASVIGLNIFDDTN